MEKQNSIIFQIESPLVIETYENNANFLIEYDTTQLERSCAIYFCSNEIYYPNTKEAFVDSIIIKNKYEWYNTRIPNTHKHIFIRDIKKQWYLAGINSRINSPEKLLTFLEEETRGYSITLIGSSAGGFASVLYGSLLNAEKVYTFNGQFELDSLLERSTPEIDPLVFAYANDYQIRPFFGTKPFINHYTKVLYFHSIHSLWDKEQYNYIKDENIYILSFITNHHGIPFPKKCLQKVLQLKTDELADLSQQKQHPLFFSIQLIGLIPTLKGLFDQVYKRIRKH